MYDDFVADAQERCRRWPRSPNSVPGPPPTACVTWLEPPERRVEADERKREPRRRTPPASTARRQVSGAGLTPQHENGERGGVDDQAASVRTGLAPADGDERERAESARPTAGPPIATTAASSGGSSSVSTWLPTP